MKSYLEFENSIKFLEAELEKLKDPFNNSKEGISEVDTSKISQIEIITTFSKKVRLNEHFQNKVDLFKLAGRESVSTSR